MLCKHCRNSVKFLFSLQLVTIILDTEGAFVEEFAALAFDSETLQIVDVFHEFAQSYDADQWGRKHVHGLNRNWLAKYAKYENQTQLVQGFRHWLRGKNVLCLLGNGPAKERLLLEPDFYVTDLKFPQWTIREKKASHIMTLYYKKSFSPVLNKWCCKEAHSSFRYFPVVRKVESEYAKKRWGVHCALYDCLECYYSVLEERALTASPY